jgi:hypothetical protein
MEKSYCVDVQRRPNGAWNDTIIRFKTRGEANDYGRDLWARSNQIREWRTRESEAPVSHSYINNQLVKIS